MPTLYTDTHRHTHTRPHNEDSLLITPKTNRHQRLVYQIKGREHSSKTFSSLLIPFHPYDDFHRPSFWSFPLQPSSHSSTFRYMFPVFLLANSSKSRSDFYYSKKRFFLLRRVRGEAVKKKVKRRAIG